MRKKSCIYVCLRKFKDTVRIQRPSTLCQELSKMVCLDGILLTVNAIGNPLKAKSNAQGNPLPFLPRRAIQRVGIPIQPRQAFHLETKVYGQEE